MSIKNLFSMYYAFGTGGAVGIVLVLCLDMILPIDSSVQSSGTILAAIFMALIALAFTIPAGLLLAKQKIPEKKLVLRLAISAVSSALAGWLMIDLLIQALSNDRWNASNIGIYLICTAIAHLAIYATVKIVRKGKK